MANIQSLAQYIGLLAAALGVLAFIVGIIVEVIKGVLFFKRIPTDILVFILSIALTLIAFFAATSYFGITIIWYMIVAAVIFGFIVAFLSMYGWEKLSELWQRFKAPKINE